MIEPAIADLIADLLLRYYRNPTRYRTQSSREAHALGHLDVVLRLALGRAVELSDPALAEPAAFAELERAAAFYIRESFFREGASHYDILGLAPDASADAVRENFRLLMQLIHPDRHSADAVWPESFATRVNRAYAVLKTPRTRADYDRQQAAAHAKEAATRADSTPVRMPAHVARRRRRLRVSVLPEWLTAGVGGFARGYPGTTIFAVLIVISALMIAAAVWPEREGVLSAVTRIDPPSDPGVRAAALPARSPIQSTAAIEVVNSAGAIASNAVPAAPGSSRRSMSSAPGSAEVEALIATFVSSYENGHLPMFAGLFDDDAETDLQRGRAAIRNEYDQMFRSTAWRRMSISQLRWQSVGDRTEGKGELTSRIGWADGREVEQRVAMEIELVRRGGRTVIAKLSLQPRS